MEEIINADRFVCRDKGEILPQAFLARTVGQVSSRWAKCELGASHQLPDTKILSTLSHYVDQITMAVNKIVLHPNSMNRDDGLIFSIPWNSHWLLEEIEEAFPWGYTLALWSCSRPHASTISLFRNFPWLYIPTASHTILTSPPICTYPLDPKTPSFPLRTRHQPVAPPHPFAHYRSSPYVCNIHILLWPLILCALQSCIKLTFSIQPFKLQVPVVSRTLFSLNANCGTMFILLDKKDVYLMGHPFHPLKGKHVLCHYFPESCLWRPIP
jgi:hypothetical protein